MVETVVAEETEVIIFESSLHSSTSINQNLFVSTLPGDGAAGKNGKNATKYVLILARVIWLSVDIGNIA